MESSSFLGSSVAETVSGVETESVEIETGAETSSFAVSGSFAAMATATVLAMVGMVFSSCFSVFLSSSSEDLAASWATSSSLFFFQLYSQMPPFWLQF
jgi:hypothetical protein